MILLFLLAGSPFFGCESLSPTLPGPGPRRVELVLDQGPKALGSEGNAKYTGLRCGMTSSAIYLDEILDDP